jgi:hypothetical protein
MVYGCKNPYNRKFKKIEAASDPGTIIESRYGSPLLGQNSAGNPLVANFLAEED